MNLKYIGHSCFLIKTSTGRRILLDPFDETIGYTPYKEPVDIITISHSHFDHSCIKYYNKNTKIINTPSEYTSDYCKINGFLSYHDKLMGLKRGQNIIYKLYVDGITICHLGDLGHILKKDLIQTLGKIDILIIPVGGNYTLNSEEACYLCNMIKSKYIIPMHYMKHNLCYKINDVSKFIILMKNVITLKNSEVSLNTLDFSNSSYNNVLLFS